MYNDAYCISVLCKVTSNYSGQVNVVKHKYLTLKFCGIEVQRSIKWKYSLKVQITKDCS